MSFDKMVNGKWEKVTVINPIVWMSEKGVCAYDGTSVYIISEKNNQRLIGHTLTSAAIGYDYASKSLRVAYAD